MKVSCCLNFVGALILFNLFRSTINLIWVSVLCVTQITTFNISKVVHGTCAEDEVMNVSIATCQYLILHLGNTHRTYFYK